MKQAAIFVTADLYLSSAIALLVNMEPSFEVRNGKTLFIFPATDSLYEAMNSYNGGAKLSAIEYAEKIKRLRAEMIIRRNQR